LAIDHYQKASSNYITLTALALDARQQFVDSIVRIGEILRTGSSGAGLFPQDMSGGAIVAATSVLDLVEDPSFIDDEEAQQLLSTDINREVFQSILALLANRFVEPSLRPSSPMITSPPPGLATEEKIRSPTVTPPAKRLRSQVTPNLVASSSSLVPPPPAMSSRTTSLGEASTSSAGQSSVRSKSEKKRKRADSKKW